MEKGSKEYREEGSKGGREGEEAGGREGIKRHSCQNSEPSEALLA